MRVIEEKTKLRHILLPVLILLLSCGTETELTTETSPSGDPGLDQLSAEIAGRPNDASLYARRAGVHYDAENYDAAIADLTAALGIDSNNVGYHYELADVYLDYYRSRLALRTLERAAALDPDRLETQLRLAETQLILRQYADATAALNQAVRIDPRNPEAYYLLSQVFAETGDTASAFNAAEEATQIDPDFTDAYLELAALAEGRSDQRALDYYNAAVNIDPADVIALHARADYFRNQNQLPKAIAEYRHLSTVDRQYVAANYNAGLLLMELDSVAQAYDEFNITLKNDPIHIRAYFYRGYAAELLGNTDQARSDYKTALRMSPDFTQALDGLDRVGE